MSSYISSSEVAEPKEWGRWLGVFLGALALGAAAIFAFVLAIDPYDSGRFGILGIQGVDDASPRTANASVGRAWIAIEDVTPSAAEIHRHTQR